MSRLLGGEKQVRIPTIFLQGMAAWVRLRIRSRAEVWHKSAKCREFEVRMKTIDHVLLQERMRLVGEFNAEQDPMRRCKIMAGIQEIESVLVKRGILPENS